MRGIKKIFAVILVAALLCIALLVTVNAEDAGALTVSASKTTVSPGDTFTVTVKLSKNPGIWSIRFLLGLDPDVFEYVGWDEFDFANNISGYLSNGIKDINNQGVFDYNGVYIKTENYAGTGNLATITYKVKSDAPFGKYNVNITVDPDNTLTIVSGSTTEKIPFTVNSLSLTVGCSHPTTKTTGAKAATCTATGYTGDTVCTVCGETVKKGSTTAKTAHTPKTTGAKAATCTSEGNTGTTVCTVCGTTISNATVIPKTAHKITTVNKKNATCTDEGYTGDSVCSVCGLTTATGTVIPKSDEHTPALVGQKDATCTEEGYTGDFVCSVCGEVLETGTKTEMIPHDYQDGVCTICGAQDTSSGTGTESNNGTGDESDNDTGSDTNNGTVNDTSDKSDNGTGSDTSGGSSSGTDSGRPPLWSGILILIVIVAAVVVVTVIAIKHH